MVIMIFRTVPVLDSKISTSMAAKIMIAMKNFENFSDQPICCYTDQYDLCNVENQTKKFEKASAH